MMSALSFFLPLKDFLETQKNEKERSKRSSIVMSNALVLEVHC